MKTHNGLVNVSVFKKKSGGNTEINIGRFNQLGRFNIGATLIIRLEVDRSLCDHVVVITTTRDKQKATKLREVARKDTVSVYEHHVPVIGNPRNNKPIVDNDNNLIRLLVMSNKGEIVSKNVAIIVQKGEFYLAPTETYRVQAHRNDNGFVCVPSLWDSNDGKGSFLCVERFAIEHYTPQFNLPSYSSWKEPTPPDASQLENDNEMIVVSWSLASGTGVGLRKDGQMIKLHYAKVIVGERVPIYLHEGEIVTAKGFVPPPMGSGLAFEAVGIIRTEKFAA